MHMTNHAIRAALLGLTLAAGPVAAQDSDAPLSAIDWFKNNQPTQSEAPTPTQVPTRPAPGQIDVSELAPAAPDSVGLISSAVSGFAPTIWSASQSTDLTEILAEMQVPHTPALSVLLTRLMVTEAESPIGAPGAFLAARIETLMRLGDVEPAISLLERVGPETDPVLFQLWADLKLLQGDDRSLCDSLVKEPQLSPGYDYTIYCLSRSGDWPTAATTLLAAEALGVLDPDTILLLTRYLDPELFEGTPVEFDSTRDASPLEFRMLAGIGAPLPTDDLPLAYAHSDLSGLIGWKAQITASERLARTGAVNENRLLGIYTANTASASGGVWDRVSAIQRLDADLDAGDPEQLTQSLTQAWDVFEPVGLRFVLSNLYGDTLARREWPNAEGAALAHEVAMLSRTYQGVADLHWPTNERQAFLDALAIGQVQATRYSSPLADAIRAGFEKTPSLKYTDLLARDADGQALLLAISSVTAGADSYLSDIADTISVLRVLGLSDFARQFSLQLLLGQDPA